MRHFSLPDRLCFGLGCMTWSPDGTMIATTSFASRRVGVQALLWEASSGKPLSVLENNEQYGPSFVCFSPDGKTLAATGREKIILWDVATGKELGQLLGHSTQVDALAYQNGGKTIVSAGTDGTVLWWDVVDRKPIRQWRLLANEPKKNEGEPFDMRICHARFSRDGMILAIEKRWSADQGLRRPVKTMAIVVDLIACKELWREDTHGYGSAFAFASDGKRLAMSGGGLSLRDAATGRQLAVTKELLPPMGMDFSPNGKTLAITTFGGLALWSPDDKAPLRKFPFNQSTTAPVYSPDGKRIVVNSSLTFRALDAESGEPGVPWLSK